MVENGIEITLSVSKTIQEHQFEPLVISLSMKLDTDEENLNDDIQDGYSFLNKNYCQSILR